MANKEIKYSVVLSIYNVEKYLQRCIESVLKQTYSNFELILVDDGSTDHSSDICNEYQQKDTRIKVIHKNNQGLGMARNSGIEVATGDYICFFDSDDFIDENLLLICSRNLEEKRFDVLCFDCCEYRNGRIIRHENKNTNMAFFDGEVVDLILSSMIYNPGNKLRVHGGAWSKVYSMDLIKRTGFRFVSEREYISEDYFSNLLLYKDVKSVLVIPQALYFYCFNDASLTHVYREDRCSRLINQYIQSVALVDKFNYPLQFKDKLAFQYFNGLLGAFKTIMLCENVDKKKKVYEIVINEQSHTILKSLDYRREKMSRRIMIKALIRKKKRLAYFLLTIKYRKKQ